jgi:carbon storage regulator
MLVLSRKKEEEIVIGEGITIKVVAIIGDKVRLGITAPPAVVVIRGELKHRSDKKRKNRQWGGTTG